MAARPRFRLDVLFGNFSLAWLIGSVLAIAYGLFLITGEDPTNRSLLLAVGLAGAGGAAMGGSVSLAFQLGKRDFQSTWTAYYVLRPLMGGILSLFVYVLVRGLYVNGDVPAGALNLYGVLAISFLSGIASKQIIERLSATSVALLARSRAATMSDPSDLSAQSGRIERYRGYLVWNLLRDERKEDIWHLNITASPTLIGNEETAQFLDIGEGWQPNEVRLQLTLLSHNAVVAEPTTAPLSARKDMKSGPVEFRLAGVTKSPVVVVEVSQRGRTVGSIAIGGMSDGGK